MVSNEAKIKQVAKENSTTNDSGVKKKKRLKGFPGVIYKQLAPLNDNEVFKEEFKEISLKFLLNPTDQLKAALITLDKGTVDVEEIIKFDPLMNMRKDQIGFDSLLQVPTQMLFDIATGKVSTVQLLKADRKEKDIRIVGKLKLLKLSKMFAILAKSKKPPGTTSPSTITSTNKPVYLAKKDEYKDISFLNKVLELNPENIDALYYTGHYYYERQEYDEALPYYSKTVDVNPNIIEAWNHLGNIYFIYGKYNNAAKSYKKAIELDPNKAVLWYNLGSAFNEKMDYPKAIDCYDEAVTLNPSFFHAWYDLGHVYMHMQHYDYAVKFFKAALEIDPINIDALNYAGDAYVYLNKANKAVEYYNRAERIDSEGVIAAISKGKVEPVVGVATEPEMKTEIVKIKPSKKLRGFPGVIYKQLAPLNENNLFKEEFKDTSLKILLNPVDQLKAVLIIVDNGTVDVEEFRKFDPLMKMRKEHIGFDALLQVPTNMLFDVATGKISTVKLLKASRKDENIVLKGKLKLIKLSKMFEILKKG